MTASLITIISELRAAAKNLTGGCLRKLLPAGGYWLLVINLSFGQANGDFRTIGNVTFESPSNWERYNGTAWIAATDAPRHQDKIITIRTGNTATVTADKTLDELVVESGGFITVNQGQTLTIQNDSGTDLDVSGTINNSGIITPDGTIVFNAASAYNHTQDGGTIPDATWSTSSDCNITGVTGIVPLGLGQSFGNFTWNCPGQNLIVLNINRIAVDNGGAVKGDFSVISTGLGIIRLSNITPRILDIGGDFNISGGTFNLATNTGSGTVNIGGDFNMTGGTINETGISTGLFVFNNTGAIQYFRRTVGAILNNIGFIVNSNVTIDFGANDYANGNGTFTLRTGATLQTANTSGINGSIQTNSRSLSTTANYTFDGSAAQVTGTFLPATLNNFRINNINGVTLTNSVTASGVLYMNSGNINTGANTFVLSNPALTALNYTAGTIVGRLERYINTASGSYFFPVGTSVQIQSLTTGFVNLTPGSLLVQYISGDPGNSGLPLTDADGTRITNQFTSGYWTALARNSFSSTNYSIELNATGFGPYPINAGTRVIKRNDAGGSWLLNGTNSGVAGSVVKRTGMSGILNTGGGTHFGVGSSVPVIITQPSSQSVCENEGTGFSVTGNGYPTLLYQWYKVPGILLANDGHFSGVTTSVLTIAAVNLPDAGNYFCIITDGHGSTVQSSSVQLSVNALPATPTISANGSTTFCAGGSITLTSSAGTSYSWSNGATTESINVITSGDYTVKITNSDGCVSPSSAVTKITVNDLPVATASNNGPVCPGTILTLTGGPSGMKIYSWTGPGGFTSSLQSPSVSATTSTGNAGVYTLTVTNDNGCKSSASTTVILNALPVATANNNGPVCAGRALNLSGGPAGMTIYSWTGPAGFMSNLQNPPVSAAATADMEGVYTLTVTNAGGCKSTATTTVKVNALPAVTAINNGPVCIGSELNLTGGPAGMTIYSWTGPAGFTSNLQSPSVSAGARADMAGVYTLTVTNSGGCSANAITTVIVNALPEAAASNNSPVCAGSALNLSGGPAGMTIYSWTGPAGFVSNSQNPSVSEAATDMAGVYTLAVTDASGCKGSASTTVVVNALAAATASNNSPVCEGGVLSLTGGPDGMATYSWTGPDGFSSLLQNPAITTSAALTMAGIYTLTVTGANGCSETVTTNVVIDALPLVTITSSNGPMCVNDLRTLTGSPAGGTFVITDGPGTLTGNVLSATGTGTISIEYTYTNACTSTAVQSIIVNEKPFPVAGPDQELTFIFETQMAAELSSSEIGEWSLISGSGNISDIHSPTTMITELSIGDNVFLWKVVLGNCEAEAEVRITVYDLFVPSVITPDGDGKNDNFKISENIGRVELFIFNRWGNIEYENNNYLNDWNGQNNKNAELPNDTYFYILKFENGDIKKGSVLIKR